MARSKGKLAIIATSIDVHECDCYKTFIQTLKKWIIKIANYFIERENRGFIAGFNNRIKVLKRRCYGLVDRKYLYQCISPDLKNQTILLLNNKLLATEDKKKSFFHSPLIKTTKL
ncbi:MAG TPA: hypothetical protein ENJ51_02815 [Leucothrix mucor]|uniref:Transposase IS204/IS1001/IS1096/IS1165 DDE domain-containing protein n=1 Tax=Leucothrix mucor TaxID=45248 RepID=A0A7V2SYD0_LEUMU|nr:hypothetical protein [Leucothrix mucor]